MLNILIVDDDKDLCLVLSNFLVKNAYSVDVAYTGDEGLKQLRSRDYQLILCDYKLPDITGIELLQKIKILNSEICVIMITGYSDVKSAVATFRYGANDYITKPLYPDELLITIRETIAKNQTRLQHRTGTPVEPELLKKSNVPNQTGAVTYIIGTSIQSQAVQKSIELVGPSELSVIISGETGTGKEFVAQSIHRYSKRSGSPFMAIDCGALPKELAGSELFGHTKGSFTGAVTDKPGSFELADGGTIFLDEIGNLSYENQVKLLRVLQERRVKRIGANRDTAIDVRIIAATNEDLSKAVKDGKLREDLFHRINEFRIELAPLRERKNDIMFFANFFLQKANQFMNKNVTGFSAEVQHLLTHYFWHGNLRELNNVIRRAVLLTLGETIQVESLPREIAHTNPIQGDGEIMQENVGMLKSIAWTAERQAIIDALDKVKHNKSKASELLNIDRKTLYNKLKLYNIVT
ncbi:MAG: sigma-54-dependent Fis family transcriptional regulator [Cyclobacteriaceae bacterium]|nr:sigma-54-dependent Fis family transcriptional regulator [Cyclobacteriaceae bacterium]